MWQPLNPYSYNQTGDEIMTVQQLIDLLNKIEDKSKVMTIEINQYNKKYPVAYTAINCYNGYLDQRGNNVHLITWLPNEMRTSVKK
jgi:hypothetical protein